MSSVAMRAQNISPIGATSKTTNINTENALLENSGINAEDALNSIPQTANDAEIAWGKRRVKYGQSYGRKIFRPYSHVSQNVH